MSFSRESRYRNFASMGDSDQPPRSRPTGLIVVGVALVLALCCCCLGLVIGLYFGKGGAMLADTFATNVPSIGAPAPTPTLDKNAPVPAKKPGRMENGLELTVVGLQRPLKVQGTIQIPADQQLILVTVKIRNTQSTGAPLKVTASEFTLKGDGGLTYPPNPKTVTIPNLLTELNLAPGKETEAELIFQIAADDSGLRLQWKSGTQTRVFLLE